MDLDDPIELAKAALAEVAAITTSLAQRLRDGTLGRLGGEIFLIQEYLKSASPDEEEKYRRRIRKLLKEVEKICSWPTQPVEHKYKLLNAIAQNSSNRNSSGYKNSKKSIESGLEALSKNRSYTEAVIAHLGNFSPRSSEKDHELDDSYVEAKSNCPSIENINTIVGAAFKDHSNCTCDEGISQTYRGKHFTQILLQPPLGDSMANEPLQLDMLFSSTPISASFRSSRWQDVGLLLQRAHKKSKKQVGFKGETRSSHSLTTNVDLSEPLDPGQFCKLIRYDTNSRVLLMIQDGKLRKGCHKPIEQQVIHKPGVSLAHILENYRLTPRIKASLAYILAYSVWKYYDSDWMRTNWTSESVQFMAETSSTAKDETGAFSPGKPYLSVRLGEDDGDEFGVLETSDGDQEIHRFPRIKALGILMVEIGMGKPLTHFSLSERTLSPVNKDWLLAKNCVDDKRNWEDFEYTDYQAAMEHCLNPGIFPAVPTNRASRSDYLQGLRQRRETLYEKAVYPLERLLNGTKWMDSITSIGPLRKSAQKPVNQQACVADLNAMVVEGKPKRRTKTERSLKDGEKEAKRWLENLSKVRQELSQGLASQGNMSAGALDRRSRRVRIAVLDTGCNFDAPYFHHDVVQMDRVTGWKDFAGSSCLCEDCDGHGTHLVSLIMTAMPQADIYVARVAKTPDALSESSENVAQAIRWASNDCQADVISMSFGFADDQPCISDAIREVLYHRKDAILLFAAASNWGANRREMFPARHEAVISIRATNSLGHFEYFNPPRNQDEASVFGTLGVKVPGASSQDEDCTVKYESGTSVAAALAAGIAGILLDYARRNLESRVAELLGEKRGMKALFRALSTLQSGESVYLTLEKLYGRSEDDRRSIVLAALLDMLSA